MTKFFIKNQVFQKNSFLFNIMRRSLCQEQLKKIVALGIHERFDIELDFFKDVNIFSWRKWCRKNNIIAYFGECFKWRLFKV